MADTNRSGSAANGISRLTPQPRINSASHIAQTPYSRGSERFSHPLDQLHDPEYYSSLPSSRPRDFLAPASSSETKLCVNLVDTDDQQLTTIFPGDLGSVYNLAAYKMMGSLCRSPVKTTSIDMC
jgi:hypothetical protein